MQNNPRKEQIMYRDTTEMRGSIFWRLRNYIIIFFMAMVLLLYAINSNQKMDRNDVEDGRLIQEERQGIDAETLRVVHLDLKGAPPLMSYLKVWLKSIAAIGCNALLVEYEDMFPFEGVIHQIRSYRAYSKTEILEFLNLCDSLNIQVIPLVQTFGHMEYVLKLQEFQGLRESPEHPETICPSREASFRLIDEMIRQVMEVHKMAKWIHIGCDEVYHMRTCPICQARKENNKEIFEAHIIRTAKMIKSNYPGVTPLIWDDMMRGWIPEYFLATNLSAWVQPVVWIYVADVVGYTPIPNKTWYWYTKTFKNIWVAGSFKGSSGKRANLPDFEKHFSNNNNWLIHLKRNMFFKETKIHGYILTGWSRYYHFAGLCELLPPSMPSLIISLLILSTGTQASSTYLNSQDHKALIFKKAARILNCPPMNTKAAVQLNNVRWDRCNFDGRDVYSRIVESRELKKHVNTLYNERMSKSEATNLELERSQRLRQETLMTLYTNMTRFRESVLKEFARYFHESTTHEWLQQHLGPEMNQLNEMKDMIHTNLKFVDGL